MRFFRLLIEMIRMASKHESNLQSHLVLSMANHILCQISAQCSQFKYLHRYNILFDYSSSIHVLIFKIFTLTDFSNNRFNYFIMINLKIYK